MGRFLESIKPFYVVRFVVGVVFFVFFVVIVLGLVGVAALFIFSFFPLAILLIRQRPQLTDNDSFLFQAGLSICFPILGFLSYKYFGPDVQTFSLIESAPFVPAAIAASGSLAALMFLLKRQSAGVWRWAFTALVCAVIWLPIIFVTRAA